LTDRGFDYLRVEPQGPLPSKLAAYDALLINSQFEVTESFIRQWEEGLILTTSNGYDHVDLQACRGHDVPVARTPEARADAVVDHTFSLIDALLRDQHRTGQRTRSGSWPRAQAHRNIRSVSDCTLGVVGYGVIGRRIVERGLERDFAEVLVHDPLEGDTADDSEDRMFVNRDELLESVDVLTLHADLNPTTRNFVDSPVLAGMNEDAYLVNTARGGMVDLSALGEALRSETLAGAALDVFPQEPPEAGILSGLPALLTTPHSAGFHPDLLEDLRVELGTVLEQYRDEGVVRNRVTPRSEQERRRLEHRPDA
jgi:phosphoglycerate dehydrogenase-like enzyme